MQYNFTSRCYQKQNRVRVKLFLSMGKAVFLAIIQCIRTITIYK